MKYFGISICSILLLLLAACASDSVDVNFRNDAVINSAGGQHALPLEIKLYQLASPDKFKQASFKQLWIDDQQVLGDSLLQKSTTIMYPGMEQTLSLKKVPGAKYLGAMAVFYHKTEKQWRVIQPIPNGLWLIPASINLKVAEGSLSVQ